MKQEAQLMLTNPRDAFSGHSRSPNIVPLSWPWNPGQRSLSGHMLVIVIVIIKFL